MPGIWAIGELAEGRATRMTLELATLARQLAEAGGVEARTVLVGAGAQDAATDVARFGPDVLVAPTDAAVGERPAGAVAAARVADPVRQRQPDCLLLGAAPER